MCLYPKNHLLNNLWWVIALALCFWTSRILGWFSLIIRNTQSIDLQLRVLNTQLFLFRGTVSLHIEKCVFYYLNRKNKNPHNLVYRNYMSFSATMEKIQLDYQESTTACFFLIQQPDNSWKHKKNVHGERSNEWSSIEKNDVCVCVCEREREREREMKQLKFRMKHHEAWQLRLFSTRKHGG
jgi:hypothetical protein